MLAFVALVAASCSTGDLVSEIYLLFEIQGTVMDEDGNPIEGIQVSSGDSDAQFTNIDGSFSFYGRSAPTTSVTLTFEDTDGVEKGGCFVQRDVEVVVQEKTPGSEVGNFMGTYFASGVEVVLSKTAD